MRFRWLRERSQAVHPETVRHATVQPRRARCTSSYGANPDSPLGSERTHGVLAINQVNPQHRRWVPAPLAPTLRLPRSSGNPQHPWGIPSGQGPE
jgi:hypothetical protein